MHSGMLSVIIILADIKISTYILSCIYIHITIITDHFEHKAIAFFHKCILKCTLLKKFSAIKI